MIKTALKNIEKRFDIKLSNIYELEADSKSYGALGYLIDNNIFLVSPTRSKYCSNANIKGEKVGELVEITGNIQDKRYCTINKLGLPAFITNKEGIFFNAKPFTNFQKWLQLENNLVPYLNWYDRMFWLDEFTSNLLKQISKFSPKNIENFCEKDEKDITIIFRHDVDDSRDLSYLKEEVKNNIPATYAVLIDRNLKFWIENLKKYKHIEISFHFESNEVSILDYFKIALNKFLKTDFKMENLPKDWKNNLLVKEASIALRKGIKIDTLNRHFSFVKYPELINQFYKLKLKYPNSLGGGNLSRATVLKNNLKCANGEGNGWYFYENDIGNPFWFPYKLFDNISNKEIDFYELPYIQEPSVELVEKMFRKKIYGVNKYIFTISLHPAHANTDAFRKGGQIETFKEIVALKDKYDLKFKNMKDVLKGLK